jgi:hypothetical protein
MRGRQACTAATPHTRTSCSAPEEYIFCTFFIIGAGTLISMPVAGLVARECSRTLTHLTCMPAACVRNAVLIIMT